jgi:DNA-binding beta-propeller fold protein YncE
LEQQPCKNVVVGRYKETYVAEPRLGWSFAGWEGCNNLENSCAFDVQNVPRKFWFKAVRPLIAKFSSGVEFSFTPSDLVLDKDRNVAYIVDKTTKRLYVFNLEDFSVVKYIEFQYIPRKLAMSQDGVNIYVALSVQEHSPIWLKEDQEGYLAVIDAESFREISLIHLDIDPYDFVIAQGNKLIVSSGSGQWADVHAYNLDDGSFLGGDTLYEQSKLTLHPSGEWVFASDPMYISPGDIRKFDIASEGITLIGDSPYHGEYPINGDIWVTPGGRYLISRGGHVFNTSDMTYVRSIDIKGLAIDDLTFDASENIFIAALNDIFSDSYTSNDAGLYTYNLTSFELISQIDGAVGIDFLLLNSDSVIGFDKSEPESLVSLFDHPCQNCIVNVSPQASFAIAPEEGSTADLYFFDARLSVDSEDGAILQYRWDLDGDGVWDSDFSVKNNIAEKKYTLAGNKTVSLQVKDSLGAVAAVTHSFEVAFGNDYGLPLQNIVHIQPELRPEQALIDSARKLVYVIDDDRKRLTVRDLETSLAVRYFDFGFNPYDLTMSPDGRELYVLITDQEDHRSREETGVYVVVFDLDLMATVNAFFINAYPYSVAALDQSRLLVLEATKNHDDYLAVYDTRTGERLDVQEVLGNGGGLFVNNAKKSILVVNQSEYAQKFSYDDSAIMPVEEFISGYYNNLSLPLWFTPDGNQIITSNKLILNASDLSLVRNIYQEGDITDFFGTGFVIVKLLDVKFDADENVAFVVTEQIHNSRDGNGMGDTYIRAFNLDSFEYINQIMINPDYISFEVVDEFLYEFSVNGSTTNEQVVNIYPHFCVGCGSNSAPVAQISYTPVSGNITEVYSFDASLSVDEEDEMDLKYRWDVNGDGAWETGFSDDPILLHRFSVPGNYEVILQVKDSLGVVDTSSVVISVANGIYQGESMALSAFDFEFNVSDVELDSKRGFLYVSDSENKKLWVINLKTGVVVKSFEFSFTPDQLSISAADERLFLGLFEGDVTDGYVGLVAIFDLEQQEQINIFNVDYKPLNVAQLNGRIIVSRYGSGMYLYDYSDGSKISEIGTEGELISLQLQVDALQGYLYTSRLRLTQGTVRKYQLVNDVFELVVRSNLQAFNFWLTPNGRNLITEDGVVISAGSLRAYTNLSDDWPRSRAAISTITFDEENNLMYVGTSSGLGLYVHDLSPLAFVESPSESVHLGWIFVHESKFYGFRTTTEGVSSFYRYELQ